MIEAESVKLARAKSANAAKLSTINRERLRNLFIFRPFETKAR